MGETAIKTLLSYREEVFVGQVKTNVPSTYAPHVKDPEGSSLISSKREARQEWIKGFVEQLERFNLFLQLDEQLKKKEKDDEYNERVAEVSKQLARYRYLASNVKNALRDSGLTIQELKEIYYCDFKDAEAARKNIETIKKAIQALEERQKKESENEQARKESRLATRDDVAQDPHVFDTQIELAYGHPNANPVIQHSSVEFAITTLFPAIDEFLEAEDAFLKDQDSFFGKNKQFVEEHKKFIVEAKQEIKHLKQGLAGAAFNRLNAELISPTFPKERFEKFVEYVKEHGNFVVVNVPRADSSEFEDFINIERAKNKEARGNWFQRLGFVRFFTKKKYISETESKERENYLGLLEKQVTEYKSDLRALQENTQFKNLLADYVQLADVTYAALIKGDIAEYSREGFSAYIENKINALKVEKQQKVGFFARVFGSEEKTQFDEKIAYLQKLKQAIDSTSSTQYFATESIKLVVDTHSTDQNPYSVQFFNSYNDRRGVDRKLCPNGLMQLANEVIVFTQDNKRDFFLKLLAAFNEKYPDASITLDVQKTDQEARQEVLLKLLERKQDFVNFMQDFKPDYDHDSGVMFFDYLQRFAFELENPYHTLADRTTRRISTSYDCLVNILLNNGCNDSLINIESNYINMVRYGVQNGIIDISVLPHIVEKITGGETPKKAKENFLKALDLVQAIVTGDTSSWKNGDNTTASFLAGYIVPWGRVSDLGQNCESSIEFLVKKFGAHNLPKVQDRKKCKQKDNEKNDDSYIQLLTDCCDTDLTTKFKLPAQNALKFFQYIFESQKEIKLNSQEVVPIVGQQSIPVTIESIVSQQNKISLYPVYNIGGANGQGGKLAAVTGYLEKYDGSNTAYAEVVSIVATKEQIQLYAQKLLEFLFKNTEVVLTEEHKKFFKENADILIETIDGVLGSYVKSEHVWNLETENAIHQIGSLSHKQLYANKRVNELLKNANREETKVYIERLKSIKEKTGFNYPDFNDAAAEELVTIFKNYVEEGNYSFSADLLADYLLQKYNPEILQQLRINMLNGFLLQYQDLKNPDEEFRKHFPEALINQPTFLSAVIAFIAHVNEVASIHGVLVQNKECELYKVGKEKVNEIFSRFLADTKVEKKWFEYAERLACAFDEDKNALQELRLRKIEKLLAQNKRDVAQQYIQFVKGSAVPEFLCVPEKKQELNELFRLAIILGENSYEWNPAIDILVEEWGDDVHKELCLIAKLAVQYVHNDAADILQVEQYILELLGAQDKKFIQGQLVVTDEGKAKLTALLQQAMQGDWNPKVELLIEYFEPVSNEKALLHAYRLQRFREIMQNTGSLYKSTDLDIPENKKELFKRQEADRYFSLKAARGSYASYSNLENYFGVAGLVEVRKLLKEYVNYCNAQPVNLEKKYGSYTEDHFDLCLLILTKEFAGKSIGNDQGDGNLYKSWDTLVKQLSEKHGVSVVVKQFEQCLLNGKYESALVQYMQAYQQQELEKGLGKIEENTKEALQALEECLLTIIRQNLFLNADLLTEIESHFLNGEADGGFKLDANSSFRNECLELIRNAELARSAYKSVDKDLDLLAAREIPDSLIPKFASLVNLKVMGNQQKEQLLAKISTVMTANQAFNSGNHNALLKLMSEAISLDEISEDFSVKLNDAFEKYSQEMQQINDLYEGMVNTLEQFKYSFKLNLNFALENFDFLNNLNNKQKESLLEKIAEQKQAIEKEVIGTFGDPSAVLDVLTAAINSNETKDIGAKLKQYKAAYNREYEVFTGIYNTVLDVLKINEHGKTLAFNAFIYNIQFILKYLNHDQKGEIIRALYTAQDQGILEKIKIPQAVWDALIEAVDKGVMNSFYMCFEKLDLPGYQRCQCYQRYQAAIENCKPYAGFIEDCRLLVGVDDIDLNAEVRKLEAAIKKQSQNKTSYPLTIYASLKPDNGFSKNFIAQGEAAEKGKISIDTAVKYIAKQLMVEQLKIAQEKDESERNKKELKLDVAISGFFNAKEFRCGTKLLRAIQESFFDILPQAEVVIEKSEFEEAIKNAGEHKQLQETSATPQKVSTALAKNGIFTAPTTPTSEKSNKVSPVKAPEFS